MRRCSLLAGLTELAGAVVVGAPALRSPLGDPVDALESFLLDHPTANKLPGLRSFARRTGVSR